MNILTVADFYYPHAVGGSAVVSYEIMEELNRRGHSITVLTRKNANIPARGQVGEKQVALHGYQFDGRELFYPFGVRNAATKIRELMRRSSFDLVNFHHASGGLGAEFSRRRHFSAPSVYFFHGPWHKEAMAKQGRRRGLEAEGAADPTQRPETDASPMEHLKCYLRKHAEGFILRRCTSVVTLSDYMLQEALEICPSVAEKHCKIGGGVDIARFTCPEDKRQIRAQLDLPTDKKILLSIRRLDARMGLENLLIAMAQVERAREDVVLIIGGEGALKSRLLELARSLDLRNTQLVGFIPPDRLVKYYQASDLFIMPSVALEGLGLASLEAMACGVPVLGAPTGGIPELLNEVLPDFVAPGVDPDSLAEAINRCLDSLENVDLTGTVRKFAEAHSWGKVVDRVEALFAAMVRR